MNGETNPEMGEQLVEDDMLDGFDPWPNMRAQIDAYISMLRPQVGLDADELYEALHAEARRTGLVCLDGSDGSILPFTREDVDHWLEERISLENIITSTGGTNGR